MKNTIVKNKNSEKMYEVNLLKATKYYNSLSVVIDDKSYMLDKIYFYNKNGIVYINQNSWFGDHSFNVFLKTSKEIKRKNKTDFSKENPFVIRSQCDWEIRYDLYLPIEDFDLKVSYEKYGSMIIQRIQFLDAHNQLCTFRTCVKYLDHKLFEINTKYQEHLKNINSFTNITEMYFLDEIAILKGLAEKYYKEQQNIADYTVEDYLKEINEN